MEAKPLKKSSAVAVYYSFEKMTPKEITQEQLRKNWPSLFKEEANKPSQLSTYMPFNLLLTGEFLHLPLPVYLRKSLKQMETEKIAIELKAIIKCFVHSQGDEHFERVKCLIGNTFNSNLFLVTRLCTGILQCLHIFN